MKKTAENSKSLIQSKMIFQFKKKSKVPHYNGEPSDPTARTTTITGTTGIY